MSREHFSFFLHPEWADPVLVMHTHREQIHTRAETAVETYLCFMKRFPANISLFGFRQVCAMQSTILQPPFRERWQLCRAALRDAPHLHPWLAPFSLLPHCRRKHLISKFQLVTLAGIRKARWTECQNHGGFFLLFVVREAKETPVPMKKDDLGLFVIKAVHASLRKSEVWCPLGGICEAFSQQTFSHHRQMPSVLQLGVNGFWTANFTAVSNAVDRGGMRDFLQ